MSTTPSSATATIWPWVGGEEITESHSDTFFLSVKWGYQCLLHRAVVRFCLLMFLKCFEILQQKHLKKCRMLLIALYENWLFQFTGISEKLPFSFIARVATPLSLNGAQNSKCKCFWNYPFSPDVLQTACEIIHFLQFYGEAIIQFQFYLRCSPLGGPWIEFWVWNEN